MSKTKAVKITFSLPSASLETALELVQMSIYRTYLLVHKALSEIVFNFRPQRYLRKNRHFFFSVLSHPRKLLGNFFLFFFSFFQNYSEVLPASSRAQSAFSESRSGQGPGFVVLWEAMRKLRTPLKRFSKIGLVTNKST